MGRLVSRRLVSRMQSARTGSVGGYLIINPLEGRRYAVGGRRGGGTKRMLRTKRPEVAGCPLT